MTGSKDGQVAGGGDAGGVGDTGKAGNAGEMGKAGEASEVGEMGNVAGASDAGDAGRAGGSTTPVGPLLPAAFAEAEAPRLSPPLLVAIERALADVLQHDGPADSALRAFFRRNERLGRRDRGLVAETAFDVLRHQRRYLHGAQSLAGPVARRLMWLSLVTRHGEAVLPALRLNGEVTQAVRRAAAIDPGGLPQAIRLSLPDWLHAELLAQATTAGEAAPHAAVESLGQALLRPAPLDLRVNLLKTDRDTLRAALAAEGVASEPLDVPQTALRVAGKPAIDRLAVFEQGWFEVQDAGSQRLVEFAAPRRGQTVVDFCAGAGGKTLALAAMMRSTGQIFACDISTARLQRLKPRLARSGATNVQPFGIDSERDPKLDRLAGRADLVLVDAPCSGTGTLRRNPELKWRMQPAAVDELNRLQGSILAASARLVKRGGALVYATCSLLHRENEAVADAFTARHPGFGAPVVLRIRPDLSESDGFFVARWIRGEG
jgi:16S rRNA (cytosine967-C5)-methyltransferase